MYLCQSGMTTRWVWYGAPLSHSCPNYIILPHSRPKTRVGACWWVPISIYRKNDKPIPACLNPNMYFCFDGDDDFLKTNNITSIHKISNEQIHNFHAYTLFWKNKKKSQKFIEIAMAFRKKILKIKIKMNTSETYGFTLGAIWDASWLSNQNWN